MQNTPTYKVEVEFAWSYPSKPIQVINKSGLLQTTETEDRLIAEKYINSFINNYKHGICEVHDLRILSISRIYTFDDWIEKYNPVKNEFEDTTTLQGFVFDYTEEDQWNYIKKQKAEYVWTQVCTGDDDYIIPGLHWVNRENYLITNIPVKDEDKNQEFLVI
jgi:hypothetical protein